MKIAAFNQPTIPSEPEAAQQSSSTVGNQTIATGTEPTNQKSFDKPSADAAREKLIETAVANKANLSKQPFDDQLSKGLLLDRLGCGNNPPPHPYNTLMENLKEDDADGADGSDNSGSDFPAEDKDIWQKDRNIPGFDAPSGTGWNVHGDAGGSDDASGREVGISLSHHSRLEGDGRVSSETGHAGTTTGTQSNTTGSGTSSNSAPTDSTGNTPVKHK